jgi:hypothetical protein
MGVAVPFKHGFRTIAVVLSASLVASSCAGQFDSNGRPRTAFERSIGTCIAAIGLGVLVDVLSNKKRLGAGTVAGGAVCAVVMVLNNEQDKKRIHDSQVSAYTKGKSTTDTYVGADGARRTVHNDVQAVPTPAAFSNGAQVTKNGVTYVGPCRKSKTNIEVQGKGNFEGDSETVCRTADGDWLPYDTTGSTV